MKHSKWCATMCAVALGAGWVALTAAPVSADPAPGSSPDNPIVVASPADVPAGAVSGGPVTDPGTGETTQTWTLTVPGSSAVAHEEYQYSKVVDVPEVTDEQVVHHDAVTHVVHHDAVTHVVHHDAVTHVVHHDAVTHVVHHDAVTHDEQQVAPDGYAYCQKTTGKVKYLSDPDWNGQDTTGGDKGWNRCAGDDKYVTVTVTDKAAWDETVTDTDGWDETVTDAAAWNETVTDTPAWNETLTDAEGWDETVTTVLQAASQVTVFYDGTPGGSSDASSAVWTTDRPTGWDQLDARTVTDSPASPDSVTYYAWRSVVPSVPAAPAAPAGPPAPAAPVDPVDPGYPGVPDPAGPGVPQVPDTPAMPVSDGTAAQGGPHAPGVVGPDGQVRGVEAASPLVGPVAAALPETGAAADLGPLGATGAALVLVGGLLMVTFADRRSRRRA
jgi:hypothetical protein